MEPIKVLITDDNEELRSALKTFLSAQEDINIVGEAANGSEALAFIAANPVDVITLDIIMPMMDGFGVMEQLQRLPLGEKPKVVVLTALGRDDFIKRALRLGADHYLVKPANLDAVLARIRECANQRDALLDEPLPLPAMARSIDDRLSNLFLGLGIPAHIKGYHYLREAVKLVLENPDSINRITKELYPAIARRFGTSSSKVERAIRHAIEVGWSRGRVDSLNRAFGCRVATPEDKPTNGEFIALIADKLALEERKRAL